jgi:hypothetical protein
METQIMMSIGKRVASIGAVVAALAIAGPAAADAATLPGPAQTSTVSPVSGAFQAGIDAALGGWNAGAQAAAGGFSAGAAALGLPFQFSVQTGFFGLPQVGAVPLLPPR